MSTRAFMFNMSRACFKSFVITFVLTVQSVSGSNTSVNTSKLEARLVPPPPPFAPPLLFPVNAATGILVAIAVPVAVPDLNVFVSYNFEANYNMPNIAADSIPGPLVRLKLNHPYPSVDPSVGGTDYDAIARNMIADSEGEDFIETTTIIPELTHELKKRSLDEKAVFTRVGIYRLLESRMNASGINGKKCLLLAICESAKYPFVENNGVIGHVLHIILTPSSSEEENLPGEYSKAEKLGEAGNCKKYEKPCNINVLQVISKVL